MTHIWLKSDLRTFGQVLLTAKKLEKICLNLIHCCITELYTQLDTLNHYLSPSNQIHVHNTSDLLSKSVQKTHA